MCGFTSGKSPFVGWRFCRGKVSGTLIARDIALQNATIDGVYFVPEPFTILGTGTALGFGVLFKKESSKKRKKEKAKV
ncbi:PEP-CTERM sorting domain-containing protein [Lyngbya aestuarii]|uniref:PEP-CTERM sorting domain-containing protein n=1 Tax=Lyngbya aestuarii TaxID=118322 RepID=UPI0009FB68A8|nr:PEP-CTERM sorting domain-containing protein [Lyngbya aestuarii]